jgi:hypothetical protein
MRFLTLIKSPESAGMPPVELMEAIGKLGAQAAEAGVLVETGGLAPGALSSKVKVSGGAVSAVDGPFDGEELAGGYAIYEVSSKEEVIEWTSKFMAAHVEHWEGWEGETEIRQIFGPEDMAPPQA